jgi:transcription initiation factor TFIID TATA-box-binding protein
MREKKMPDDEPWIRIQNVVASASLNHRIDVEAVCKAFPKTEYRPEIFPGLVFRLKRPKTATLIFNSGKMVCTGAKSEKESIRAVISIVRRLKKAKILIKGRPEIKIVNIVASANLGGKVDLYGLYEKYGEGMGGRMMYEPEQFPGLIYRMEDPKAVILVFASGKLVCTGTRKEADVNKAIQRLRQRLDEYGVIMYSRPTVKPFGMVENI